MKMKMKRDLRVKPQLIATLICVGLGLPACTSTDEGDCEPQGQWSMVLSAPPGNCFPNGFTGNAILTLTAAGESFLARYDTGEQPIVEDFTRDACVMLMTQDRVILETPDNFGVQGTETTTLAFEQDELSGNWLLTADLFENGVKTGSCVQSAGIFGGRVP